jgi:tight adherence protein C
MLCSLIATGALAVLVGPEREALVWRVLIIGLGITVVLWALPRLILKLQARRRVERITHSLPFALDMITMCLSGGAPFSDALKHVTYEISDSHPDLADELYIVHQQAELSTLELALRQFAARIDTPEVIALAALVNQNQALGTETSQAVRDYSENLRLEWRQAADERANRVSVFALLPLVLCLLPAVFIIMWGPAAVELWDFLKNMDAYIPGAPDLGSDSPLRIP